MSRAITRATIDTKGKTIDFVFHDADTDQLGEPGRMAATTMPTPVSSRSV